MFHTETGDRLNQTWGWGIRSSNCSTFEVDLSKIESNCGWKSPTTKLPEWCAILALKIGWYLSKSQSGFILSPLPTDLIGLNGCSIIPSSRVPNLAKRFLLFVLPHHFTFPPPLNILVRQQFVLLHFSNSISLFLILQHWTLAVNTPLGVKSHFFSLLSNPKLHQFYKTIKKIETKDRHVTQD